MAVSAFCPPQARRWVQILAGFGLNPRRRARDPSGSGVTTIPQAVPVLQLPQDLASGF